MAGLRGGTLVVLIFALLTSGCGWAPKNQLTACQSQNRILSEQSTAQLAEIEKLKVHTRSVEDQLIRAEAELARLENQNQRRADRASPDSSRQ